MGVSTNAVLFYGYCWNDEEDLPEDVTELWESDEPVLAGHHGSDGWRVPYLYVQSSERTARRGYPEKMTNQPIGPNGIWDGQLQDFCERFDITPPEGDNQPGWWMVSWWG